ncbi:hypothetical protein DPMN_131038 [Dreissena polymorpha]|uniref:Uncharacterized protein n=1 Tax=Dreissena polymorpha TaxID=45954 RepID=A0A9D4H7P7_DREPO|nr:hypothetical protein DPMN_131038 [Dreissena polymorpha]
MHDVLKPHTHNAPYTHKLTHTTVHSRYLDIGYLDILDMSKLIHVKNGLIESSHTDIKSASVCPMTLPV